MLYLAGECEDNDMWLFCGEELSNYLRNHDLEDEPFLKQTGCLPYVIMLMKFTGYELSLASIDFG
jgi:hypothetical protein